MNAERSRPTDETMTRLTATLDGLTDAIREFSWILLEHWKWHPVEEGNNQATSASVSGVIHKK